MKNMININHILFENIHFDPPTYTITQIIQLQSLEIFPIPFWHKDFVIFWFVVEREERKRGCRIPMIEIKTWIWHQFRPSKWEIFVLKWFIWCKKFVKKHIWAQVDFLFRIEFSFWSNFLRPWMGFT